MKIAMLAPFDIKVPAEKYGGTELVVYHLVEGLIKRGHEVTLFAADGSNTSAKLISYGPELGVGNESKEALLTNLVYFKRAFETIKTENFDIIHNHAYRLPMFFSPFINIPFVSTLHTPLPVSPESQPPGKYLTMEEFQYLPYISISNDQRSNMPFLNFVSTVYNGTVDPNLYTLGTGDGSYLVWIGRFTPEKGAHIAIKIAKSLNLKLKLAAKALPGDSYFENEILAKCDGEQIVYVGEVNEQEKIELLRGASCFLNPIQWKEPFGLVVSEANSCGTPVVAFKEGSMSELIKNNDNGFLVDQGDVDGFINVVRSITEMSSELYQEFRKRTREYFSKNFSIDKMVDDYIEAYAKIISEWK